MSKSVRVRGLGQTYLAKFRKNFVICLANGAGHIVVVPGSSQYDFLRAMPTEFEDLELSPSLANRYLGGYTVDLLGLGSLQHAIYGEDAVVILGLLPKIAFVMPNTEDLQRALLLGRGVTAEMFAEFFGPFQKSDWRLELVVPKWYYTEPPKVHWVQHSF
jgi:hypothetical protein